MPVRQRFVPVLLCIAVGASSGASVAEAPRSSAVDGLKLGDTPASIVELLKARYPQCDQQRSAYHALPGEKTGPLAIVMINEGTMNVCTGTPQGADSTDVVIVRFAHPDVAPDRGTYELLVERRYPDPLLAAQRNVRYPLDRTLADLRKRYGAPTDEQRERGATQAASYARSLGANTKRDDQTVRLLWATRGKLPAGAGHGHGEAHGHGHVECDCGDLYVIAEIDTTRAATTRPANRAYVTRVSVFAVREDVRRRQNEWNGQWLRQPPKPLALPADAASPSPERAGGG